MLGALTDRGKQPDFDPRFVFWRGKCDKLSFDATQHAAAMPPIGHCIRALRHGEVAMSYTARSALVLQGGGALGAYELGAARALYEGDAFAPDLIRKDYPYVFPADVGDGQKERRLSVAEIKSLGEAMRGAETGGEPPKSAL